MNQINDMDKKYIQIFRGIIPRLSEHLHKGQAGRIGLVGGSPEYSGSPYFAAISALRIGADLSYIFCATEAGPAIKSYSPELIVYPRLLTSTHLNDFDAAIQSQKIHESVKELNQIISDKLDALIVGPGLSRDPGLFEAAKLMILSAKQKKIPIILDADAIALLIQNFDLLRDYPHTILTPNIAEYRRLCTAFNIESNKPYEDSAKTISSNLNNALVILKGASDIITNSHSLVHCNKGGSSRRCGGQGDILSGTLGIFAAWMHKRRHNSSSPQLSEMDMTELQLAVGYSACRLVREAAAVSFEKRGRSMLSTDMIEEIGSTFAKHFEPSA